MNEDDRIAYTETIEIIKCMPQERTLQIPESVMNYMQREKSRNHVFRVDPTRDLVDQGISYQTKVVLAALLRMYWASAEQREALQKRDRMVLEQEEQKKRENFNYDIFNKNKKVEESVEVVETEKLTTAEQQVEQFKQTVDTIEENKSENNQDVFGQLQTEINKNSLPLKIGNVDSEKESIFQRIINFFKKTFKKKDN